MAINIRDAKAMLASVKKEKLGFFPTPMYRLDSLSEELGINLYIKRDDFTGSCLFGGNKTRKLEYLIGKAKSEGAEYVFTYGATQSNHAMQTAWAAAKNGLKAVLYLAAVVPPDEEDIKANMLLDKIFGAEVHVVYPENGEDFESVEHRSFNMGKEHIACLEREGHKCMDIPMGGANGYGSLGYVNAMVELKEQMDEAGIDFDYLYHATGSGGTMAGIVAGNRLLGMNIEIHSIAAMGVPENYLDYAMEYSVGALRLIGAEAKIDKNDYIVDENHYGEGYEIPSEGGTEAIKMLAGKEGILVDPVYSGKALAGLISDARTGTIPQGSNVLFLHTGGATVFFAEKEILGDL